MGEAWRDDVHRVAHTATAALKTTCLQFNPGPAAPLNAPIREGQSGLVAPVAAAAYRALIAGRYKERPTQER